MDMLKAITFVLAYEKQGKLSGSQRRLLMMARTQIWETAELHRQAVESPITPVPTGR